jgi:hypothetical protein
VVAPVSESAGTESVRAPNELRIEGFEVTFAEVDLMLGKHDLHAFIPYEGQRGTLIFIPDTKRGDSRNSGPDSPSAPSTEDAPAMVPATRLNELLDKYQSGLQIMGPSHALPLLEECLADIRTLLTEQS